MKSKVLALIVALLIPLTAHADYTKAELRVRLIGLGMRAELASEVATLISGGVAFNNNDYLQFENAAGTAEINAFKVDASDNLIINTDAANVLKIQIGDDANRIFKFDASSDTAQSLTWGDGSTAVQIFTILSADADASDDSTLRLSGGGAWATDGSRGATISLPGEEVSGGSDITYNAGAGDTHIFSVAGTAEVTIADDDLTFSGASAAIDFGATSGIIKVNGNTRATITAAGNINLAGGNLVNTSAQTQPMQLGGGTSSGNPAYDSDLQAGSLDSDLYIIETTASTGGIGLVKYGADATGLFTNFFKTRSASNSGDANTIVQSADQVHVLNFLGANGATYDPAARIVVTIDGTPGASADMPGAIDFQTSPDGSATPASVLKLNNGGAVHVAKAADLIFDVGLATVSLQEAVGGSACMGTLTCNSGTDVTVSTTCATTGSRIFLQRSSADTDGVGQMYVKSISNGSNFVVNCVTTNDTSTANWIIFHEAP